MDEHFAKILGRLQTHQRLFEEGLLEIYSTEMIVHYNLVDKEMMAQDSHRQYTKTVIASVEKKLDGLQKQLDHDEATRTELFEKETRGQFSTDVPILTRKCYFTLVQSSQYLFFTYCLLSRLPISIRIHCNRIYFMLYKSHANSP